MVLEELKGVEWLEPWRPTVPGLEIELAKEVGEQHPLYKVPAVAIGRRLDCDDVLFFLPDNAMPLAVVHLTWAREKEKSAQLPWTEFYSSLSDWVERRMKPDSIETSS